MSDVRLNPRIKTYSAPETIPADFICRVLRIPYDLRIMAAVSDVLAYLTREDVFEASDSVTEIEMRALMAQMLVTYFDGDCDEPMIGELRLFVVEILPSNVLLCDGSEYNQGDYPTLAAVLPASLKDDIAGTFTTPNFSGRFPVGSGDGFDLAATGGEEEHILTIEEMPEHNHETPITFIISGDLVPEGAALDIIAFTPTPAQTSTTGGDEPHNNMPPYFAVKIGIVAR